MEFVSLFKSYIREFNAGDFSIQQCQSLPFLENGNQSACLALEVLMNIPKNYSDILKEYWGDAIYDMVNWAKLAEKEACDVLALKFNILSFHEISKAVETFKMILNQVKKPFIVCGSNKKILDEKLLPELIKAADRPCIFGVIEQENYEAVVDLIVKSKHSVIARSPMDINLAKELNILLNNKGVSLNNILIDTNIGALGYGLDYGYSIIEKVKLAGLEGDEMLNMPIVSFVGEEAWKAKEARVDEFSSEWGEFKNRALNWEAISASSFMLAGSNLLILWHPDTIRALKNFEGVN